MGIEGKHAYRFVYLKSEKWQNVRIEALAREGGKCQICGEESISNDAHHVWYPESIWETRSENLVILCRPCHEEELKQWKSAATVYVETPETTQALQDIFQVVKTRLDEIKSKTES